MVDKKELTIGLLIMAVIAVVIWAAAVERRVTTLEQLSDQHWLTERGLARDIHSILRRELRK